MTRFISRTRLSASLAAALAVSVLAFAAAPVSAGADGADFLAWRWDAPGPRGLGLIKTGPATMQIEVIGLTANRTAGIVLNSVGCGKQSKPSNTLATYGLAANAQGAAQWTVELENVTISSIKSVRVFKGNTQLDCGTATPYSISGVDRPMESLSINFYSRNGMHFAVMVENDEIHWVGHDFVASSEFEMLNSRSKCPNQPNQIIIENVWISSAKGTVYGATSHAADPWDIRSFQLFDGSNRIACGKAIRMEPV